MPKLYDTHGRVHDYLRVSLTERCNLRCHYCMPADGVPLSPKEHLCSYEELLSIIDTFCELGVRKIRITGGEPLVRQDVDKMFRALGKRPVELALTTNGLLVDRFIDLFSDIGLRNINVSLDTLEPDRFRLITRRPGFESVMENIRQLVDHDFRVKLNMVVMRGVNDDEIVDFAELARAMPVTVRYIEFMPFDGNRWDDRKMVPAETIRGALADRYMLVRDSDAAHDTTRHYSIPGFRGRIGIISSMSEYFCGSCNRIRLLANGGIQNCLFSENETDLRTPLRRGDDLEPIIRESIRAKKKQHAGMFELADMPGRTMTTIGG
ncbi:GTP 3',8-cyclase MoaA [Natronogracilivirga saccharolytica]|uniref:GTP 3',8-cyclase n=1 Tax=Natronogracilivirga saccharolytica TaxID=2812953 RepID=A0A8J7UU70_9BACT|nr:GTP 3',8-cyclase MoaA [Natronogracilivirga saccharolytica]MBP3193311.1 GTP 3',8-cyclase MoaA [Natronogracilivirga saccharolytica]